MFSPNAGLKSLCVLSFNQRTLDSVMTTSVVVEELCQLKFSSRPGLSCTLGRISSTLSVSCCNHEPKWSFLAAATDRVSCDSAHDGSIMQFVVCVRNSVYINCMSGEQKLDTLSAFSWHFLDVNCCRTVERKVWASFHVRNVRKIFGSWILV